MLKAGATQLPLHPVRTYGVAALCIAAVTLLRIPLGPLLGNSVPFILYFPAVVIAGWYGGFGPALLATGLSGYFAKVWLFDPDGGFTIHDSGSAFRLLVFLASGTLISFLCGRLHQRSAALHQQKLRLEETVAERTRSLERALADMEAFSYSVSHDLRSPIKTLGGFSEILLQEHAPHLNSEGRLLLERIRSAAGRLDRLITELLALAKVSNAAVETRPIALREAVGGLVESSARWSLPEIKIDYQGCVHTVMANQTLLNQVLQNLLENAMKFIAPGAKPEVRLRSEAHGDMVRLWVEDNGIGIAPSDQARLFKLFERAKPLTYEGTGIGLAIVERAVEKMHGRIGVESAVGVGSRFWIELAAG
jgi:signal transduction histidine kinase